MVEPSPFDNLRVPIFVSDGALNDGIDWIRGQKEAAIDSQDFDAAASWRDQEKLLISALGGKGLMAIEPTPTPTEE